MISSSTRANQLANKEFLFDSQVRMEVGDEREDCGENEEVGDGTISTLLPAEFLHGSVAAHD